MIATNYLRAISWGLPNRFGGARWCAAADSGDEPVVPDNESAVTLENTMKNTHISSATTAGGRAKLRSAVAASALALALPLVGAAAVPAQAAAPSAGNGEGAQAVQQSEATAASLVQIERSGSFLIEAEDEQGRETLTQLRIRGGYFDFSTDSGEIELLYRDSDGVTSVHAYPVEWVDRFGPNIEFGIKLPFNTRHGQGTAYFETEIPGLEWDMGYYAGGLIAPGAHEGLSGLEADVEMMRVL